MLRFSIGKLAKQLIGGRVGQQRRSISRCASLCGEKKFDSIGGSLADKYRKFDESEAEIVFDVDEERKKAAAEFEAGAEQVVPDKFAGIDLTRGQSGVFEIEELVNLLRKDRARDIFVCKVPKSYHYVDYMCIVSGTSSRHVEALGQFVYKLYKHKRSDSDKIPRLEGRGHTDWLALDLGNIALHIFLDEVRAKYDLELLWSVGTEYDDISNQPDDFMLGLLNENSLFQNLRDDEPGPDGGSDSLADEFNRRFNARS